VKNKAIDIYRGAKGIESLNDYDGEVVDIDDDVAKSVESEEGLAHLMGLIESLPENYHIVFSLRYVHGMSRKEIADALDISENLVSVRLNRAKQKLVEQLRGGGDGRG